MLRKRIAVTVLAGLLTVSLAGCGGTAGTGAAASTVPSTEASAAATASAEASATPTPTEAPSATPEAKPINLVFLNGTVEMVDFWDNYFKNYNASNPDKITVEHQFQKEATKTLQVMMASGSAPDLIACSVTQDMIDNAKLVDLTNATFWSSLNPAVKEFSTDAKSGKAYAVGTMQGAVGMYYNTKIFEELGLKPANTWAEFTANLKTIKEKKPGVTPFYMGGKDGWMLSHLAEYTFQAVAKQKLSYPDQQKAMLANDLATLGWDASPTGALATLAGDLTQLKKEGLINANIVTATYDNQTTAFATGKAAVISQGIWAAGDIQKKNADTSFVGFGQYPAILDGTKPAIGSGVDGLISLSAESPNKEAAMKVLESILQPDTMKAISEARKAPSANPSVVSDWGYLKDQVGKVLSDSNVASVTWTTYPSGFNGDDSGRLFQELFAGKYAKPEAFAKAWTDAWMKGTAK